MRTTILILIGAILVVGCAGIEKRVRDACDVVAEVDDATADLLMRIHAESPGSKLEAEAEKLGEAVVRAHGICFRE